MPRPPRRCSNLLLMALTAALLPLGACDSGVDPDEGEIAYRTPPPAGSLPWPQHSPQWGAARVEGMLDSLFIVNNFGIYQANEGGSIAYLHSGLDVVLPNGTPIHAVQSGTVVAQIGGNEFYRTLIIEDDGHPGHAWAYTHVYDFRVAPGQHVQQGTLLAVVNFQGLEHIHLSRMRLVQGGSWTNFADLVSVYPDSFFTYRDTEAPVFEGRFRYARNTSSDFFIPVGDAPAVVSGEVDIVVGLRDGGEYARSRGPFVGGAQYGDRNAPKRIEYTIRGQGVEVSATAIDFSKVEIAGSTANGRLQALLLFHVYELVRPAGPPVGNNNRRFNFYVLTHHPGPGQTDVSDPDLTLNAWKTDERNAAGQPRFPNGDYTVTVRAYDHRGNVSERSETVRVQN